MTTLTDTLHNGMTLRFGWRHMEAARTAMAADGLQGPGQLLARLGVAPEQLARLGVSPVDARTFLNGAQGSNWRSLVNISRQMSSGFSSSSAMQTLLAGVRNGWAGLESPFPALSRAAQRAAGSARAAGTQLAARANGALETAKQSGFFSSIGRAVSGAVQAFSTAFPSVARVVAPVVQALKGFVEVLRIIPGINYIFVAVDGFKLLTNPSLANLAKFGLSAFAALPIPGASLVGGMRTAQAVAGGARGVWALSDGVQALAGRKSEPSQGS